MSDGCGCVGWVRVCRMGAGVWLCHVGCWCHMGAAVQWGVVLVQRDTTWKRWGGVVCAVGHHVGADVPQGCGGVLCRCSGALRVCNAMLRVQWDTLRAQWGVMHVQWDAVCVRNGISRVCSGVQRMCAGIPCVCNRM